MAVSEISRIERGSREVRLTTLMRLVDALGASPESPTSSNVGIGRPAVVTDDDVRPLAIATGSERERILTRRARSSSRQPGCRVGFELWIT
jgi:hypothetical protein